MNRVGALRLVLSLLLALWTQAAWAQPLIVLDPGHGPASGGATSVTGVAEVRYNDRFVAELAAALQEAGWHVLLTRRPDQDAELTARAAVANVQDALALLSIHHDSTQLRYLRRIDAHEPPVYETTESIAGYSLFVSGDNLQYDRSLHLGTLLGTRLRTLGRAPNLRHAEEIDGEGRPLLDARLGVYRYDELAVLRHSKVPAVLLEVGVIVDRRDEAYVDQAANRRSMIEQLVFALQDFARDQTPQSP